MKAIEINGEIKTFGTLPKSWNDGERIHENIKDYAALGFKDVVYPTFDSRIEEISKLHLDGDVYTYDVVDLKIEDSLSELKARKIQQLKYMVGGQLSSTDWYIIRESDSGEATPVDVRGERAELRTKSDTIESEIKALTSKKAVLLFDINF